MNRKIRNHVFETNSSSVHSLVISNDGREPSIKILGKVEPYIDHQSIPSYDIEIINTYDKDAVINFVFNKNVSLKTDCD